MATESQAVLSNLPPELQRELDVLTQQRSKVISQTWKLMVQILSSWAAIVVVIVLLDTFTHAGKLSTFASFLVGASTAGATYLLVLLLQTSREAMEFLRVDSGVTTTTDMHR